MEYMWKNFAWIVHEICIRGLANPSADGWAGRDNRPLRADK